MGSQEGKVFMSRFKDVVKTSEDMRDKINTYYDVSVKDLVDLADHYQGGNRTCSRGVSTGVSPRKQGRACQDERRCYVMSKIEEIFRLCIEVNTTEELEFMLTEDCWSLGAKRIFREEIERRRGSLL